MFTRKVVTSTVAALAAVALSVPTVHAQIDGPGPRDAGSAEDGGLAPGSLGAGSLDAGSVDAGSLGAGSLDAGEAGDGAPDGDGAEEGSLAGADRDDGGVCELPGLGGSVAKFYPLFGLTGLPAGVMDLITSALDSFPNLLDVVAGEGGGAALLGQTGSLTAPLCTSIFGGEIVYPPVTVIVDPDGNPVTTVTGTPTRTSASASAVTSTQASPAESVKDGEENSSGATEPGEEPGTITPATSVPTP